MVYLIGVSLLWAFSFGLIKVGLSDLDSTAVAAIRLSFALLAFLPFFRPQRTKRSDAIQLIAIGAVQFGLMYVLYIAAFKFLLGYEVAMFAIFTPIYVVLLDGALARHLDRRALAAAALALVGAGVLKWQSGISSAGMIGFLLMQGSNICFAAGQIHYQRLRRVSGATSHLSQFAWLYLGAVIATFTVSIFATNWTTFAPSAQQWSALVYLGILASGVGFFGWNVGATKVSAGTLAVFNNLKIPLAVAVSLLVFHESGKPWRLAASLVLLGAALYLTERRPRSST